jgi:hypothetical protein
MNMLRRISVPFLVMALGALTQGCSSSSSSGGTGGAGGATADGGTGGKGTGGVTTGTGGMTTASGGAPGTDAATDTPRDVATDVVQDATTDTGGANIAVLCPRVDGGPGRNATSPQMTAPEFCQLYLQTCMGATNPDAGYTMLAECMTAYTALNANSTRECRSYHVCNAAAYADITMPNVVRTHCGHSIGIGLCADTTPDAGGN